MVCLENQYDELQRKMARNQRQQRAIHDEIETLTSRMQREPKASTEHATLRRKIRNLSKLAEDLDVKYTELESSEQTQIDRMSELDLIRAAYHDPDAPHWALIEQFGRGR